MTAMYKRRWIIVNPFINDKKTTPIDRGGFVNPNEGEKSLGTDSLQQNGTNFIRIHIG